MIDVTITDDEDVELAKVTLEKITDHPDGTADYSVRFAVERGNAVGIHQRSLYNFPGLRYNVLALLLQALSTLDESELKLEDGVAKEDLDKRPRILRSGGL